MRPRSVRPRCLITLALFVAVSPVLSQTQTSLHQLISLLGTSKAAISKAELAKIGSDALPELVQAAYNKSLSARLDAIELLGKIGTVDQCPELIDLMIDPHVAVREPASKAFDEIIETESKNYYGELNRITDPAKLVEFQQRFPLFSGYSEMSPDTSQLRDVIDMGHWRVESLNALRNGGQAAVRRIVDAALVNTAADFSRDPGENAGWTCGTGLPFEKYRFLGALARQCPVVFANYLLEEKNKSRTFLLDAMAGKPPAVLRKVFLRLASDSVDSIRQSTCFCLSSFKDEESVDALINLTNDKIAQVQFCALIVLRDIAPERALPEAIRLCEDRRTRYPVLDIVGDLGTIANFPKLVSLLDSHDRGLADRACAAISSVKGKALGVFKSLIDHGPKDLRVCATRMLVFNDASSVIPTLIHCLDDQDKDVVIEACHSLKQLGDPESLPNLIRLNQSKDPDIRAAAKDAVDNLSSKSKLPPP